MLTRCRPRRAAPRPDAAWLRQRSGEREGHQQPLGAQSRVSAELHRLCALHGPAARPAPPAARPRPPAALLPRPPPATQTGCAGPQHRLPRLPRGRRAAETSAPRSPNAPDAARPSPPCARDGPGRRPARYAGSCSPCRAAPPRRRHPGEGRRPAGWVWAESRQATGVRTWWAAPPPAAWAENPESARRDRQGSTKANATPRRKLKGWDRQRGELESV